MKTRSTETPAADPQAIHNGFSLISNQKLLQLYVTMVKCRLLEDRMSQLAQEGKISGSRAASGQEASAVGLLLDLLADDAVSPAPNDVIARFIKGESLERILDQILGKALGKPGVVAAGVMPAAPSDAIRLSIATGAALDAKMQGGNRLVAALCGDGSTAPELWYEVLSFAGAHKLPILFLCQHSLGSDEIELKVSGCGVPCFPVDGNDVVAVYRVASECITRTRQGWGPALIECREGDWDGRAAGKDGRSRDPIVNMEQYLTRKGLFEPKMRSSVKRTFGKELNAALAKLGLA